MALTNKDLDKLGNLMKVVFKELVVEEELVTKKDISHLPTKEEFYKSQDELMVELQTIRENQEIGQNKIEELDEQVETLKSHPVLIGS